MSELYGIQAVVKASEAQAPVVIGTEVVFIGISNAGASISGNLYVPVRCSSYKEYEEAYEVPEDDHSGLTLAAQHAFNVAGLDHAWFINLQSGGLDDTDITVTEVNNGISALDDIYNNYGVIPSMVVTPNSCLWAGHSTGVEAISAKCRNLSDHFKCQVIYDNALVSGDLVEVKRGTVSLGYKVNAAHVTKDDDSGNAIACIGANDKEVPMSVIVACARALQDKQNIGELPYRTVGNLPIPATSKIMLQNTTTDECVLMGPVSKADCDALAAAGYVGPINKGAGKWYLWGDHTAAVSGDGTVDDELYRFDSNVAMTYHLANRFILKWGNVIDDPMTLALRNDIINEEQNYLNYCVAAGALIGSPRCEFRALDNTTDKLQKGQFTFTNIQTVTIPAKYIQLNLVYTSEGINSYIVD